MGTKVPQMVQPCLSKGKQLWLPAAQDASLGPFPPLPAKSEQGSMDSSHVWEAQQDSPAPVPPCLPNAHPKYCSISVTEHSLEILLLPRIQINESVKLSRVYQRGLETSYGPPHTFRGILEIPMFILITALCKGKCDLLIWLCKLRKLTTWEASYISGSRAKQGAIR